MNTKQKELIKEDQGSRSFYLEFEEDQEEDQEVLKCI